MTNYVLPDLRLPFASTSHPHAGQVQQLTEDWCRRFGLLSSARELSEFRALGHGRIMATLCPRAWLRDLALLTDWNSFFVLTARRVTAYEELVESLYLVVIDISKPTPHDRHPLVLALRDLLRRTIPGRRSSWVARFQANLYGWLRGHLAECGYRNSRTVPTVDDYIAVRRDASAVLPMLDLVELAEDAVVPDRLYRTSPYQTLVLGTADLICWSDLDPGDPVNFVTVLAQQEQIGVQEAIYAVTARIGVRVAEYLGAAEVMPEMMYDLGIGSRAAAAVMRCVADQQSWVQSSAVGVGML